MARAPAVRDIEALPEADRLEDFPHPRHTEQLYGHEAAERAMAQAFASGRMHHGWLLCGPQGIGKATLAYRIARHALAAADERDRLGDSLKVPSESASSRQVKALSHPGLLVIRRPYDQKAKRFAATIPVDEVRRLRGFVSHHAGADAWRVIIVDSADELNVNAANALLKSLEEPPQRAIFLLVSSAPGRLLPTIRSRCRRLDLAPLGSDAIRRAALQALAAADMGAGDAELGTLEHLAEGSVRQLLTLSATGGGKLYERVHALVAGLPRMDWAAVHALADELGSVAAAQKFETFFGLLFDLMARLLRAGATGEGRREDLQLAERLLKPGESGGRLASWAELWEVMLREKADTVALNLDRKGLILDCCTRMEQLARK